MGRHDLLREAQQYAVNHQHAKALELLQRYVARCLAVVGSEDAAEKQAMAGEAAYGSRAGSAHQPRSAQTPVSHNNNNNNSVSKADAQHNSQQRDKDNNNNNNSSVTSTTMASRVMSPPPDMRLCSDIAGAGKAYRNMGYVLLEMNQPKAALDAYEKGLKIARQLRDRRAEGKCLASMGACYERCGQYDHCISLCSEGEVMSRECGNRKGESVAIGNAAMALATMGQYRQSVRLHERALLLAQACGDVEGVDVIQENLECTRDKRDKYEAALKSSSSFYGQ